VIEDGRRDGATLLQLRNEITLRTWKPGPMNLFLLQPHLPRATDALAGAQKRRPCWSSALLRGVGAA